MSRFTPLKGWQVDRSAIAILQEAVNSLAQPCGEDRLDSVRYAPQPKSEAVCDTMPRLHDSEARALGRAMKERQKRLCEEH